jgi:hypothetical protein
MTTYRYCTPEWLKESARLYRATPSLQKQLAKITSKVFFRIKAEPAWGIDEDFLFGAIVDQGALEQLSFFNETEAKAQAEFIMAATPQEWKKVLRKENKFLTDFMLGKITLEQGTKVGVLSLAPYANAFIDALTQVELQFPDEMSPSELAEYRSTLTEFRERLGG